MELHERPIEGAEIVKLNDENENMEVMRWNYLNVTASTNAEGEFELGGVRKNGGTVMASAEGYSSKYFFIEDNSVPIECEFVSNRFDQRSSSFTGR